MNIALLYLISGILIFLCLIYGLVSQTLVNATFNEYSSIYSASGITGAEVARRLLKKAGANVEVVRINGTLTDCYNSKYKVIKLSNEVYDSNSISALGVAAHETGHAIQDCSGMFWFKLKTFISPVLSLISRLCIPLVLIGAIVDIVFLLPTVGFYIVLVSVISYGVALIFNILTLPLEYDASKRALKMLKEEGFLTESELKGAKSVLRAALHTYISSFMTSLVYFLRFLGLLVMFITRREH
ncbi:MAG: zinc metallopeptidase [Clostridia bacterium]|nr:zinc metallopeptidase [Clostridia bacterium]